MKRRRDEVRQGLDLAGIDVTMLCEGRQHALGDDVGLFARQLTDTVRAIPALGEGLSIGDQLAGESHLVKSVDDTADISGRPDTNVQQFAATIYLRDVDAWFRL